MTLIGQGKERTRLQQVIDWCGGPDWDGPLIFDEATPLSSCSEQGLTQHSVPCSLSAWLTIGALPCCLCH